MEAVVPRVRSTKMVEDVSPRILSHPGLELLLRLGVNRSVKRLTRG